MKKKLAIVGTVLTVFVLMSFSYFVMKPSLYDAIRFQNTKQVKELLDAGANPNERSTGNPMLYYAAAISNCDIIKMLVDKGAEINGKGIGDMIPLQGLIASGVEPDSAMKLNKATNALLLKRVKGDTAKVAKWIYHEDITRFSTVYDRAKLLISLGSDVNVRNMFETPFLEAILYKNKMVLKAIFESGKVNVNDCFNKIDLDINKKTKGWLVAPDEMTALMFAVGSRDIETVKLLLEHGADANIMKMAGNKKVNAHYMAVINNYTDIAELLKGKTSNITAAADEDKVSGIVHCVAFVMQKASSGFGSKSISYACMYIEVESNKTSKKDIINAARNHLIKEYGNNNGYNKEVEVFYFDKKCVDCKKIIDAKYQLSDFQINNWVY